MAKQTKDIVLKWYYRAQLDYFDTYINLFIAYNAWFKKVTKESKDRAAINKLKERAGIWDEYLAGETMIRLTEHLAEIVDITNHTPLENLTGDNKHWDGIVKNTNDWQSLIEYWYRIRCNLFHGEKSPEDQREAKLVKLAYESLNIFMGEIIDRMEKNFDKDSIFRLYEIYKLKDSTERSLGEDKYPDEHAKRADSQYLKLLSKEEKQLMKKLDEAKNLWEVDLLAE